MPPLVRLFNTRSTTLMSLASFVFLTTGLVSRLPGLVATRVLFSLAPIQTVTAAFPRLSDLPGVSWRLIRLGNCQRRRPQTRQGNNGANNDCIPHSHPLSVDAGWFRPSRAR
jgi:hypothetical protein